MTPSVNDDSCPVSVAVGAIGEHWTILILRDLIRHPARRFQDLQDSLKGCAPNTLSARLKALEKKGLIERRFYADRPPRAEYVLTKKGQGVKPVIAALFRLGTSLQDPEQQSAAPRLIDILHRPKPLRKTASPRVRSVQA